MPKILHYDELRGLGVHLSKSQLARLEKTAQFPRRVRLSGHRYGYVAAEIDAWIRERIAERDGAPAA
jgi:predicted DNA-binding transcriptional regulator AlpA